MRRYVSCVAKNTITARNLVVLITTKDKRSREHKAAIALLSKVDEVDDEEEEDEDGEEEEEEEDDEHEG
jgi:hypothetical protein